MCEISELKYQKIYEYIIAKKKYYVNNIIIILSNIKFLLVISFM